MAKNEAEDALLRCGIQKNNPDFENAVSAVEKISGRTGADAERVLEILGKHHPSAGSAYAVLEQLEEVRAKIEANEKGIDECERKFAELQERADWMVNIREKGEENAMERIGDGVHERLVAMYYGWKRSELETRISELGEENGKLGQQEAALEQVQGVIRGFENILRSSELGAERERRGGALIERVLRR